MIAAYHGFYFPTNYTRGLIEQKHNNVLYRLNYSFGIIAGHHQYNIAALPAVLTDNYRLESYDDSRLDPNEKT